MKINCTTNCNNCGNPNQFVKYIKRIIKIAKFIGVNEVVVKPNLDVLGCIYFNDKIIHLRNDCLRISTMTICHEVGHWIAYFLSINRRCKTNIQQEFAADIFGYIILKMLIPKRIICNKMWKIFCKPI